MLDLISNFSFLSSIFVSASTPFDLNPSTTPRIPYSEQDHTVRLTLASFHDVKLSMDPGIMVIVKTNNDLLLINWQSENCISKS